MTQELLEAFQAHPGVEKIGGRRVAKAMNGAALLLESGFLDIFYEPVPPGTVTEGLTALAAKESFSNITHNKRLQRSVSMRCARR